MLTLSQGVSATLTRVLIPAALMMVSLSQAGCERSLNQDATTIAQQGKTTSSQIADFYGDLENQVADTYRFDTARRYAYAYAIDKLPGESQQSVGIQAIPAALPTTVGDKEKGTTQNNAIQPPNDPAIPPVLAGQAPSGLTFNSDLYRIEIAELEKRKQFARAAESLYDGFLSLSTYNTSDEFSTRLNSLKTTLKGIGGLQNSNTTDSAVTTLNAAFADLITTTQNSKLVASNSAILKALKGFRDFYNAELPMYKDIAKERAIAVTSVRRQLVQSQAVVSTGLYTDVLGTSLTWPANTGPFTDSNLKAMSIGLILADNDPVMNASNDASDQLLQSLNDLVTLQTQLGLHRRLSTADALQQSHLAQEAVDYLKSKSLNTGNITQLLQLITAGGATK